MIRSRVSGSSTQNIAPQSQGILGASFEPPARTMDACTGTTRSLPGRTSEAGTCAPSASGSALRSPYQLRSNRPTATSRLALVAIGREHPRSLEHAPARDPKVLPLGAGCAAPRIRTRPHTPARPCSTATISARTAYSVSVARQVRKVTSSPTARDPSRLCGGAPTQTVSSSRLITRVGNQRAPSASSKAEHYLLATLHRDSLDRRHAAPPSTISRVITSVFELISP